MQNKLSPLDFQRFFPTSGLIVYVPRHANSQVGNTREFLRNKIIWIL